MIELFRLFDNDFQSQNAAKCDLLIHIGFETFQYAIVDIVRDELKSLAEYHFADSYHPKELIKAIEKLPENQREFKFPFNKVSISFDTFNFTLIPESLYEEDKLNNYASYFQSTIRGEVLNSTIKSEKIINACSIHKELHSFLIETFNKPRIYSQSASFIEGIKKTYKDLVQNALYLDVQEKHIQLAMFNQSGLSFYNIFDCQNPDELNYYLLHLINTLQILPGNYTITLSGKINPEDENYRRVQKYFKEIQWADCRLIVNHPQKFDQISSHTYFSLFCLEQCES